MFNLSQHFIGVRPQLAEIHFAMADAPGQGVLNRVRLLENLFLHIVAVDTFIASVILQIGFDLLALHLRSGLIKNHHRTASHFRDIAFFEEDEAAGNRQQCQLVGGDKVFTHPQANYQRATGAGRQQSSRVTGIHDHRTVSAAQLRDSAQDGFTQGTALFQLPVHQMGNNFGIGLGDEDIAARLQQGAQRLMVFDDPVMDHHNVFRNMRMRIALRRFAVRRPTSMGDPGTTV